MSTTEKTVTEVTEKTVVEQQTTSVPPKTETPKTEKKSKSKTQAVSKGAKKRAKAVKPEKIPHSERKLSHIDYKPIHFNPTGGEYKGRQLVSAISGDSTLADCQALLGQAIIRFFFANKKQDRFSGNDALNLVIEKAGHDYRKGFPAYPDSPLHRGLHACSKNETHEVAPNKDGKLVDTFARGIRAYCFKEDRVGKNDSRFYSPNPKTQYDRISDDDLKAVMLAVAAKLPDGRKASMGIKG